MSAAPRETALEEEKQELVDWILAAWSPREKAALLAALRETPPAVPSPEMPGQPIIQHGDVVRWKNDKCSAVVQGNLWENWNLVTTLTSIERNGEVIWRRP